MKTETEETSSKLVPHTSLIVACYKVERYLPDFLCSLDTQVVDHADYELIFVIDGCPENSLSVVTRWAEQTDFAVRIIEKVNGGVASARNVGIENARGEWISCPDPDDWLHPNYLSEIEVARSQFPEAKMLTGRVALINAEGKHVPHPMEFRFNSAHPQIVNLAQDPEFVQTLGGTVFFHRESIDQTGQRFDENLPQASDTDFIMRFLLNVGAEYVLVPGAVYEYRRRTDGTSIVDTQANNDSRYRYTFEVAHRSLLLRAGSECPAWLANTLLYFVYWPFRRALTEDRSDGPQHSLEINTALRENLKLIGANNIANFRLVNVPVEVRLAWQSAASDGPISSPVLTDLAYPRTTLRRVLFYSKDKVEPLGTVVVSSEAKIVGHTSRRLDFFGATWLYEHVLLIDAPSDSSFRLDARQPTAFEFEGRPFTQSQLRQKMDLEKPRVLGFSIQSEETAHTPTRASFARRMQRIKFAISFRIAIATRFSPQLSKCLLLYLDETKIPRDLVNSLATAAQQLGLTMWAVSSNRRAIKSNNSRGRVRVVRKGSVLHFLLLKFVKRVIITSPQSDPAEPFESSPLQRGWQTYLAPSTDARYLSVRALNTSPLVRVVVSTPAELQLLTSQGGKYRFTGDQVILWPGYRDSSLDSPTEFLTDFLGDQSG